MSFTTFTPGAILHAAELNGNFALFLGPLTDVSGIPTYLTSSRVAFQRTPATSAGGEADFEFIHQTPSLSLNSGDLHFVQRTILEPGANDASENWGILARGRTDSAVGGRMVAGYFQSWRNATSNAPIWAALAEAADFTGLNSADVGNATSSMEMDIGTTGLDNAVNPSKWGGFGNRHLIHFVAVRNQGTDENEVSHGLWFGTNNTRIDSVIGFQLNTRTYQVLDTRGAIPPLGVTEPVAALRMQQGQVIDFNGGPDLNSPNSRHLRYIDSLDRLTYFADSTELFRIQDNGVVLATTSFSSPLITGTTSVTTPVVSATTSVTTPVVSATTSVTTPVVSATTSVTTPVVAASTSVTSPQVGVTADASLVLTNQTTAAASAVGTLTNAPTAGDPDFWLRVSINGVLHKIPAWL